jgi:hemolysin III
MSPDSTATATLSLPPRSLRLSGTAGCPRWRGRLHLIAATLAVPAGAALLARHPSPAIGLYVLGLVALYAVSSGYHLLPLTPLRRRRLRQADHAMIYVFTAASVTPFCQLAVRGRLGAVITGLTWIGAAAGVFIKVRGFDRAQSTGAGLYLVLGWLTAITFPTALHHLDGWQVGLLAGTACFYSGGAAVLFTRRPDPVPDVFGYHEVWHGAVVAAGACYFALIWGLAAHPA